MKKVVYNITRYRQHELIKISGLGYITDTDLIIACTSKEGKPYIRVFEDCIKDCHPIPHKTNEYAGGYYEIREVRFEVKDSYETKEVQLEYKIWYKLVD